MTQPPVIDYTDKDYDSLRQAMLDLASYRLPEWTDRSAADVGVLLVDLFAYMGDVISYYQDRIANESYLDTAIERRSIMHMLRLIGYELAGPTAAAAELDLLFTAPSPGQPTTVVIPTGARFEAKPVAGSKDSPPAFEHLGAPLTIDLAGDLVAPQAGMLRYQRLPVRHSKTVSSELLGSSTGEPNQRFALAQSPVVIDTLVVTVDEGAGPVTWSRQASLAYHVSDTGLVELSTETSRDYTVLTDETGASSVVFGDGEFGRRPPVGVSNIRASYSVGGGASGNAAANMITTIRTAIPGLAGVTNPQPASGGTDAESVDRAARFGPLAFRSGDRAVTLRDYTALTLQAGGVAKVKARSTGWNRVDLYVAPAGDSYSPPLPELRQRLVQFFENRRMVGTSVRILEPTPVPVDIAVDVICEHNFNVDAVQARVTAAVHKLLAFANVDFGRPLYLSKVYEAVEAIDGVLAATVVRFRRQDQAPPRAYLRRRGTLLAAGLGAVDELVQRAFNGEIVIEGRIGIGDFEIPVPGAVTVQLSAEVG
jgi:hypothetical protein